MKRFDTGLVLVFIGLVVILGFVETSRSYHARIQIGRGRYGKKASQSQQKRIPYRKTSAGRQKEKIPQQKPKKPTVKTCLESVADINCFSCKDRYRKCSVFQADKIISIISMIPIKAYTDRCQEGKTYGFQGRNLWTTNTCKAKFRVCYTKAKNFLDMNCSCKKSHYTECSIKAKSSQKIKDAALMLQSSTARCNLPGGGKAFWGLNSKKKVLWVDKGCAGRFRVFF